MANLKSGITCETLVKAITVCNWFERVRAHVCVRVVIYIYHDHPLRLPSPSIATATATANHIIP